MLSVLPFRTRFSAHGAGAALAALSAVMVPGIAAHAQAPVTHTSPDSYSSGGTYHDMSLQALLLANGIGSNPYSKSDTTINSATGATWGSTSDQLDWRAFKELSDGTAPEIDVLFDYTTRRHAAGYQPNHKIGWYVPGLTAPASSDITDVVWDGSSSASWKLTSNTSDFAALGTNQVFSLRLYSPGSNSTPIYSQDNLNTSTFRNINVMQERDLAGAIVANSYIVGWEDLLGGGDSDFQDIVMRVKYVEAVPAPGAVPEPGMVVSSIVMFGTTGAALLRGRRRRRGGQPINAAA